MTWTDEPMKSWVKLSGSFDSTMLYKTLNQKNSVSLSTKFLVFPLVTSNFTLEIWLESKVKIEHLPWG